MAFHLIPQSLLWSIQSFICLLLGLPPHFLTPPFLFRSRHVGLFTVLLTSLACSHLRAFVLIVPFSWEVSPQIQAGLAPFLPSGLCSPATFSPWALLCPPHCPIFPTPLRIAFCYKNLLFLAWGFLFPSVLTTSLHCLIQAIRQF